MIQRFNNLVNLFKCSLKVVDRGSETQPQVVEHHTNLFDLTSNIYKS